MPRFPISTTTIRIPKISRERVRFQDASIEHARLHASEQRKDDWKLFGPYVSERSWGTVREDYSENGNAWSFFPHSHANKRAYRWGEDGIAAFCDRHQRVCLSVAFWNGRDPFLKERLFGLSGPEGNHGEDCKELYYYVDGTPTHSYAKMIYKYPMDTYPYELLVRENGKRNRTEREFELLDAMPQLLPPQNRYFDCHVEWAKVSSDDLLCTVTVHNRSNAAAPLHVLPQMILRNVWRWGESAESDKEAARRLRSCQGRVIQPLDSSKEAGAGNAALAGAQMDLSGELGQRFLYCEARSSSGERVESIGNLFCDNETNLRAVFGTPADQNITSYPKDTINNHVVAENWMGQSCEANSTDMNPNLVGSKYACHYNFQVPSRDSVEVIFRFSPRPLSDPFQGMRELVTARARECDEFYDAILAPKASHEEKCIQRQALAGMLWSKQFFNYQVSAWLDGDDGQPKPPFARTRGRNADWRHLHNSDVISMPDKWEYPWYAAWDLAFHTVALTMVDPEWAKRQLVLMLREWYMHPNGAIPAYEWSFSDVNPPVHAWACYRVYKMSAVFHKERDLSFLRRCFHKLILNFTWWVNRKDANGTNLFDGGFLGLDNIGVFDRSNVPEGWKLMQADSTAWMSQYCLQMLAIAIELALHDPVYEEMCTKFLEHFVSIALQIRGSLWDEESGFFYDRVVMGNSSGATETKLKYRSFVGLLTLLPCLNVDEKDFDRLPDFKRRTIWFIDNKPGARDVISFRQCRGEGNTQIGRYHFAVLGRKSLERVLSRCFDEKQFLSPFGLRSLSKEHQTPYKFVMPDGSKMEIRYEPGESSSPMYGGNSNWRGPIWIPTNYAIIEALGRYGYYYQDSFLVEFPSASGDFCTLDSAAAQLSERLVGLFKRNTESGVGARPIHGQHDTLSTDENFRDLILYYEYFHGETGEGLGASHQTGWTGLIAKLIQRLRRVVPG